MDEQKSNSSSTFSLVKKYLPFGFLALLTFALMFFFKHNKEEIGKIFEEGKNDLLALYASNLKPLLISAPITEEDVFNFALYQSLPLDKNKNKVLVISSDVPGNQVYEIRTAAFNPSTKNYETYVKYLGLNKGQKEKADSILNSYKKEIYSSVFVSDKNSFAVNPKISQLQQAVLADFVSFTQKVNPKKAEEIFRKSFTRSDDAKLASLISSARQNTQNEFLLFTPDTVAKTYAEWNQQKFNKQINEIEKNREKALQRTKEFNFKFDFTPLVRESTKNFSENYKFIADSNMYKVVVPDTKFISKAVADSIRIKLNEVASNLKKMSIELNKQKIKYGPSLKIPILPATKGDKPIEIEIVNPYEIINKTFEALSKGDAKTWERYGVQMDSLGKIYDKKMNDSIKMKIRDEMRRLKNGIKKSQTD